MRYFLIVFVFLLTACSEPKADKSQNIIEEEKLIEVLKDQAMIESALNLNIKNVSGAQFDSAYNFNVYKENNITKAQYDSTLKYYSSKPGELKRIMEIVLERLNIEKSKR